MKSLKNQYFGKRIDINKKRQINASISPINQLYHGAGSFRPALLPCFPFPVQENTDKSMKTATG
jgi:hypothetical protein